MSEARRLTRPEIEILRRSVGASGQLPRDQLDRLLDEAARLLDERQAFVELISALGPPWRDVRGALNEIHRLLNARTPEHGHSSHASDTSRSRWGD